MGVTPVAQIRSERTGLAPLVTLLLSDRRDAIGFVSVARCGIEDHSDMINSESISG